MESLKIVSDQEYSLENINLQIKVIKNNHQSAPTHEEEYYDEEAEYGDEYYDEETPNEETYSFRDLQKHQEQTGR